MAQKYLSKQPRTYRKIITHFDHSKLQTPHDIVLKARKIVRQNKQKLPMQLSKQKVQIIGLITNPGFPPLFAPKNHYIKRPDLVFKQLLPKFEKRNPHRNYEKPTIPRQPSLGAEKFYIRINANARVIISGIAWLTSIGNARHDDDTRIASWLRISFPQIRH